MTCITVKWLYKVIGYNVLAYEEVIISTALWRQGLQETRVLVHSKFMVEAAKKCGISDEKLVKERDAEEGIQVYQSSSREVQRKVLEWEIADQVVHADLILR